MKIILVALLCCLTLQVLEASPVKNSKEPYEIKAHKFCKSGEIVEIGGLKCKCENIPNGVSWECEGHFEEKIQTYSAKQCTPGTNFKEDCNTCFCGKNGLAACTKMLCIHEPIQANTVSENTKCIPGTQFNIDCNSCFCTDSGVSVCTRMLCDEDLVEVKPSSAMIEKPKKLCTPGEVVEIAGLRCECNEIPHGLSWKCEGHFEKHVQTYSVNKCTPGTNFKIDCNTCFCGDNGLAACTLMECGNAPVNYKKSFPNIKPEDLCTPGEVVENAGLKCECKEIPHGMSWKCEGHFEKHVQTYSANKCTPGTNFKIDCNTCFCSDAGIAACTRMLCPSKRTYSTIVDVFSPEFKCEPNTAFTHPDGCNTCTCDKMGRTNGCTRMLCPSSAGQLSLNEDIKDLPNLNTSAPGFKCTPGMRFRDDCNICRCGDNGMAACTDMACPKM